MSTFFSLLFFVFLGVAASSVLEYRAGNATDHLPHAFNSTLGGSSNASNITLDGSERIGRFYTALFTELVKANDFTNLDWNLQDSFSFSTCTKQFYPKEKFLEIVRQEKQNLTMKFERSTFTSSSDIKVYVTMKVLGDRIAAYFMLHELHKGSWQWHEGRCLAQESYSAPRRSFPASLAGNATDNFPHASNSTLGGSSNASNITLDGSERIGQFYTALFTELVKANDFTNLDWNLQDSFSFSTCTKRFYAKEKFLEIVRQEKKNLTMKFERSTFTSSSDIKVYVTMNVLGDRIAAYFMLHEIQEGRWQWLGGRCLARESYSAPRRSFSASFIRNGTNDFPHASNNTLGGSSNASNITLDGSERIGRFYTALFNELVKANDISNLSWNIRDSFSFSTCTKQSYAKEKFLEIVLQEKKNLTMKFERSVFTSSTDIKVYVTMKVLGDRIAAYFMLHELHKGSWQWHEGRCLARESYSASRRFFSAPLAGNATDNFPHASNSTLGGSSTSSNTAPNVTNANSTEHIAETYTMFFNEYVKGKDLTSIADKIHDDFWFKGCKRNYDKRSVLEIVHNLPKNEKFALELVNSKWVSDNEMRILVILHAFGQKIVASLQLRKGYVGYEWVGGRAFNCSH